MKKFIHKTSFFIFPFSLAYFFCLIFYSYTESPDLLRLGLIPNLYKNYQQQFTLTQNIKYETLSNHTKKKYTILTIGDSFSEQGGLGYKNFLAEDFSVLHIDRFISANQIQTLINFSNGDFFDTFDIEYVILQNVERHVTEHIKNFKLNDKITLREIDSLIQMEKKKRGENKKEYQNQFFSRTTIEFPFYSFPMFFLHRNYLSNNSVYNVDINSSSLFSNNSNKLLFYKIDLINTKKNNNIKNIDSLNIILNAISQKLSQKNITLIFLPCPDKYDFYYEFITDKKLLTRPLFFNLLKDGKKEYIYIDSKEILTSQIKKKKDLYFYDDTHWSPIGAEIIANKIKEIISSR